MSRSAGPLAWWALLAALVGAVGCSEWRIRRTGPGGPPPVVSETFDASGGPVDVLIVLDTSRSMEDEWPEVEARLGQLFAEVRERDFRLAVAPMRELGAPDHGQLAEVKGLAWLDPDTSLQARFAELLQVERPGAAQGLATAAGALEHAASLGFERPGVPLHLVFVSDDEDSSVAPAPAAFLASLGDRDPLQREVVVHALLSPSDASCGGVRDGRTYRDLVAATGGALRSLCVPADERLGWLDTPRLRYPPRAVDVLTAREGAPNGMDHARKPYPNEA